MDATWAQALIKLVPKLVQGVARAPRVAYGVARAFKQEKSIHVSFWQVYRTLRSGALYQSFKMYGPDSAAARLELHALAQYCASLGIDEHELRSMIYRLYVHVSPPSVAADLVGVRNEKTTAAAEARVLDSVEAIDRNVTESISNVNVDTANFRYRLSKLPRYLAVEAEAVQATWAPFASVLARFDDGGKLPGVLRDLLRTKAPLLASATPEAMALCGEIAEVYGDSQTAAVFYEQARLLGISADGYWRVRQVQCEPNWNDAFRIQFLLEGGTHPWATAAIAQFTEADEQAVDWLATWKPRKSSEVYQHHLISARAELSQYHLAEAADAAENLYQQSELPGAAHIAIESLLLMGTTFTLQTEARALDRGLRLALDARDSARRYGIPSGEAVSLAMEIACALNDPTRAIRLGTLGGDGEADERESLSEVVLEQLLLVYARQGATDEAGNLLSQVHSQAHVAEARARLAMNDNRNNEAIFMWHRAISRQANLRCVPAMLWQLAELGALLPAKHRPPGLDPAFVAELDLVAKMALNPSEGIAEARSVGLRNPRIALSLINWATKQGPEAMKQIEATVAELGRRYEDAQLMLLAAEIALDNHKTEIARDRAELAMKFAPNEWGQVSRVLRVTLNAAMEDQDWDAAVVEAMRLSQARPNNPWVSWALIEAWFRSGEFTKAHEAWETTGKPRPVEPFHVHLWAAMRVRVGVEFGSLTEGLSHAALWPEDEQVNARIAYAFLRTSVPDDEANKFGNFLKSYFETWPDGGSIKQLQLLDGDLLTTLNDLVNSGTDYSEVEDKIREGEVPIGIASSLNGRTYTECLVLWGFSPRHSLVDEGEDGSEALKAALARGPVLDLSAIFSLSLLDSDLGFKLFGAFPANVMPAPQYVDAQSGAMDISQMPNTSLVPRGPDRSYIPVTTSDRDMLRVQSQAVRMAEWARSCSREAVKRVVRFSAVADEDSALNSWLVSAELALTSGRPLWSDEATLRSIVRAEGGQAFSTFDVLIYLVENKVVSQHLSDAGQAALLAAGYAGLPWNRDAFELAINLDGGDAKGVAQGLRFTRDSSAGVVMDRLALLEANLREVASNPDVLQKWCLFISDWMHRLGRSSASGTQGAEVAFRRLVRAPWLSPWALPFVVRGFIAGAVDKELFQERIALILYEAYQKRAMGETDHQAFQRVRSNYEQLDSSLWLKVLALILRA